MPRGWPGSVAGTVVPFALQDESELIVDPGLLEPDRIFFNAARLDRSMALRTDDYLALAAPRIAKIADGSTPAGSPSPDLCDESRAASTSGSSLGLGLDDLEPRARSSSANRRPSAGWCSLRGTVSSRPGHASLMNTLNPIRHRDPGIEPARDRWGAQHGSSARTPLRAEGRLDGLPVPSSES